MMKCRNIRIDEPMRGMLRGPVTTRSVPHGERTNASRPEGIVHVRRPGTGGRVCSRALDDMNFDGNREQAAESRAFLT